MTGVIAVDKKEALLELARVRQLARWDGFRGIGDYHDGCYECNFVSPYTKSAGNVDSDIFVLLQDWSSDGWLSGPLDADARSLGYSPGLPTNRNLNQLLQEVFATRLEDVYATNLFPFVKVGGLSAAIPRKALVKAAMEFAIPQIRIVQPKVVICLGLVTYNAVREATQKPRSKTISEAIEHPFLLDASWVWCQAHTGALGQANRKRGNAERVREDWLRMRQAVFGSRVE